MPSAGELTFETDDGVVLAAEQSGSGPAVVLLHGLTATRRYVVMGSRLLERSGLRTISYDARGHGESDPAPDSGAYGYERLAGDLLCVLDSLSLDRSILAGASMGAHTLVRFAIEHPQRVGALALITPAFDPSEPVAADADGFAHWDALARGLREHGVQGFIDAYDLATLPEQWRELTEKIVRQRMATHRHPRAVADALEAVPRSRPFEDLLELERITVPTVVVGSRDEADPMHPLAVAERYARLIPGARLEVEERGPPPRSPIAWQGGQLSRLIADLAARAS